MPISTENKPFNDTNLDSKSKETLTLLKILAIGDAEVADGKLTPAQDVFQRLLRT
jgi:hypothetical protein